MNLTAINTNTAPEAIGPYSQAVKAGDFIYISGQIPLDPSTMTMVGEDISQQAEQVFNNLKSIAEASGTALAQTCKLNISLTNLAHFDQVNDVMKQFFEAPYPARACVQVAALPKEVDIEVEAILYVGS